MAADSGGHRRAGSSRVLLAVALCLVSCACRGEPAVAERQLAGKHQADQVALARLPGLTASHQARPAWTAAVAPAAKPPTGGAAEEAQAAIAPVAAGLTAQPKRIRKAIDWQAALSHPVLGQPLPAAASSALHSTGVPVLLPMDSAFLSAMLPVGHPDWYSLSSTYGGMTVVVQGDRVATIDPEMVPTDWQPPTWQAPLVTRNEGIVEATFLAWGASYAVSIECADPAQDRRCTEDAALLNLVQALRRWPGQPGEAP